MFTPARGVGLRTWVGFIYYSNSLYALYALYAFYKWALFAGSTPNLGEVASLEDY